MDLASVLQHKATRALCVIVIAIYLGVGELGIIAVIIWAILANLSETKTDHVSGYAVFNHDQRALPGSLSVEDFDQARRNQTSGRYRSTVELAADVVNDDEREAVIVQRASKFANKPCSCNSGLKYKKCCGKTLTREDVEKRSEWESEWT